MSFSGRTPESLLPRSDSRNPATTCKGITTAGRPCRRALAASPSTSPALSPSRGNGVLAVLDEESAAAFFCWQHKDQAERLAEHTESRTSLRPLKNKTSIDTLVDRVGILELDETVTNPTGKHRGKKEDKAHGRGQRRRDTFPQGWNHMQSPLMTVPEEIVRPRPRQPRNEAFSGRSNVKFSWACCLTAEESDEERPPPRRRTRNDRAPTGRHSSQFANPPASARHEMRQTQPRPYASPLQMTTSNAHLQRKPVQHPTTTPQTTQSQTQSLLSLIPKNLSPQTTSSLLSELSRPISPHDEAGYIYIFWLTPEAEVAKPEDDVASTLLDDDEFDSIPASNSARERHTPHHERTEATLQRHATVRRPQTGRAVQKTILLKIGRAANVHRRMTQWSKQCGQDITLIRFYPYQPSSSTSHPSSSPSSTTPGGTPNKVPYVSRVERLIHIELGDARAHKAECANCGREHREWFEVEASRRGLVTVDAVVRRWVRWAQQQAAGGPEVERA